VHPTDLPALWLRFCRRADLFLDARITWRLPFLLVGILFAGGRRTVTAWLRAADLPEDFRQFYPFLASLARSAEPLAGILLAEVPRATAGDGGADLFALDDTPTPRYGPHVQGAGVHHNPTPGPAGNRFLYGHVFVTLAAVPRHPDWGVIGLPLRADLYVREKDVPALPAEQGWRFRTKLELAAEQIRWLGQRAVRPGRAVRVAMDGAYSARPVLRAAAAVGVVAIGRLRKDAALWSVPRPVPAHRRGRRPTYGRQRIRLAKRAGQTRGWQEVTAWQYGRERVKRVKTFVATWRPAGGRVRVALVREDAGWLAFFSTDVGMSAAEILESAAARTGIEQVFKDLKEVTGAGQQQVRDVGENVGCYQAACWGQTLVELWAWDRPAEGLVEREEWDGSGRRPSHAEKRKALQQECLRAEYQARRGSRPVPREIDDFVERLIKRTA
jgi:hypothetical protein